MLQIHHHRDEWVRAEDTKHGAIGLVLCLSSVRLGDLDFDLEMIPRGTRAMDESVMHNFNFLRPSVVDT